MEEFHGACFILSSTALLPPFQRSFLSRAIAAILELRGEDSVADVFINYKREERDVAERLAKAIQKLGYSVWTDAELLAGDTFAETIKREVLAAKCMIVIWSRRSVESDWVRAEADLALQAGKLLPIRIDDVELPIGFRQIQTADIADWRDIENDRGFQHLTRGLSRFVTQQPAAEPPPGPIPASPRREQGSVRRQAPLRDEELEAPEVGAPVELRADRPFNRNGGAWRTQLFIAHASVDKPKIKPIVEVLIRHRFKLWIDKPHEFGFPPEVEKRIGRIQYRDDWQEQIRQAVQRAHVVLAFWSQQSLQGDRRQFFYEVYMGLIQQKLRQVRMDRLTEEEVGYPYRFGQMADISIYEAGKYHPELDKLMTDISRPAFMGL